jgi:hypothetical protein
MSPLPLAIDPGAPVPVTIRVLYCPAAIRVVADHDHGLVVLKLAAEEGVQVEVAPEAALTLALHLTGRVADLRHVRRGDRP